jgi:hypothetical protein
MSGWEKTLAEKNAFGGKVGGASSRGNRLEQRWHYANLQ